MTVETFTAKRAKLVNDLEQIISDYRTLYPTDHPEMVHFLKRIEEQAREELSVNELQQFYQLGFYDLTTGQVLHDWMKKHNVTYDDVASFRTENMMTSTGVVFETDDQGIIINIEEQTVYDY